METEKANIHNKFSTESINNYKHMASNWSLTKLMHLSTISNMFERLFIEETRRRIQQMKNVTIAKGLLPHTSPVCFHFTNFSAKLCEIQENSNELKISGLRFINRFLKLFGKEINYIICDFFECNEKQANSIFFTVNQTCINLNHLALGNLKFSLRSSLLKSFENTTNILFQNCVLKNKLCNISKYFPNIKEIIFSENTSFENLDRIFASYKFLEKIEIYCDSLDELDANSIQILNPEAEIILCNDYEQLP